MSLFIHQPFIPKAIEQKMIKMKRYYRCVSQGFVRVLLSRNQGGEALHGNYDEEVQSVAMKSTEG